VENQAMTTQTSNDFTPVFIDFETPHDKTFSLSKLATVLYVRNPLFKVFGVGIAIGDQPIRWFTGEKIQSALETIDWNHSMMVAHNAMFEATVLNEHFGIQPARYCDTAGMARAYLPTGIRADLDSAASAFGLGTKIKGVLESLKGVFDPNPEQLDNLGTYCKEDVHLCRDLFNLLWPHLPETERYVLHMTVRMSSESRFELDQDILRAEIANAKQNRVDTIDASGSDLDALSSNQQFAETLRQLTGSCPVKYNKNGQEIPALSKSDAEYVRFKTDHPDLLPLFDAREAAKSTIMLRRPERYLEIAQTGRMPMPYRYWGAHTGRFSGADGLNVQNLPNLHKSDLRRAFKAPPGYVVHVADSSQIELRIQLWFSDALVLLNRLARGLSRRRTS
jgi:DNA polymerase